MSKTRRCWSEGFQAAEGAMRLPRRVWRTKEAARFESWAPRPRRAAPDDTKSRSRIELPIVAPMANVPSLSVVRDPARPKKLGRYELEECLGVEGGHETYR